MHSRSQTHKRPHAVPSFQNRTAVPPPAPAPRPNVFFRLSPAAVPSLLVPFYETSLTLILLGGRNPPTLPPRRGEAFLVPPSALPAPTLQPHGAGTRPLLQGNPDTNPSLT